jgi:hypothetical protein
MQTTMERKYNVLVVGEPCSGKTQLILSAMKYLPEFLYGRMKFTEWQLDAQPVEECDTVGNFDVAVIVVIGDNAKASVERKNVEQVWKQYAKLQGSEHLPAVLVVTGCEFVDYSSWKLSNYHKIITTWKGFRTVIPACFVINENSSLSTGVNLIREYSARSVIVMIMEHVLSRPVEVAQKYEKIITDPIDLSLSVNETEVPLIRQETPLLSSIGDISSAIQIAQDVSTETIYEVKQKEESAVSSCNIM